MRKSISEKRHQTVDRRSGLRIEKIHRKNTLAENQKNCYVTALCRDVLYSQHTQPMKYLSLTFFVVCLCMATTFAQHADEFRSIGNGIDVDADGRVLPITKEKSDALGKMMANVLESPSENLNRKVTRRTISLKKLDAQVRTIVEQYEVLPDSIRYLGGLTSIDYIIAVPDENDLLLVGPAEGWQTDAAGNVVGKQTGLPVLALEDFLAALRLWNQPTVPRTLVCSIEPAQESVARLTKLHQQFTDINAQNADAYATALEEAYGENPITILGVSATSRFARILVAADFQMKRIALGLEPSRVRNIPSYVGLISTSRPNISPRFWLVPEYATITHDSAKMTWQFGDLRIRVSSHTDYFSPQRNLRATGADRAALTWCRNMEENYDALAKSQPVFGELRNNMRFALVAALIRQENLLQKSDCTLTILLDESKLKLVNYPEPKFVSYRSIKTQSGFSTIVACGGIEINPQNTVQNHIRLDNRIDTERERLIQAIGDGWWSP